MPKSTQSLRDLLSTGAKSMRYHLPQKGLFDMVLGRRVRRCHELQQLLLPLCNDDLNGIS